MTRSTPPAAARSCRATTINGTAAGTYASQTFPIAEPGRRAPAVPRVREREHVQPQLGRVRRRRRRHVLSQPRRGAAPRGGAPSCPERRTERKHRVRRTNLTRRGFLGATAGARRRRGGGRLGARPARDRRQRRARAARQARHHPLQRRDRIGAPPTPAGSRTGSSRCSRPERDRLQDDRVRRLQPEHAILGRQITPAEIRQILDDNGLTPTARTGRSRAPSPPPPSPRSRATARSRRELGDDPHRHRQRPDRQQLQGRLGRRRRALEHVRPDGHGPGPQALHPQPRRRVQLPARQRAAGRARPADPLLRRPQGGVLHGDHESRTTSTSRWTSTGRTSPSTASAPTPTRTGRAEKSSTRRPGGQEHAPVPAVPRQGRQRTADPPGVGIGLHDGAARHRATSTTRRSSTEIGAKRSTIRCRSRTTLPAARPNPGRSLAFSQVSYNNMAALGPIGS